MSYADLRSGAPTATTEANRDWFCFRAPEEVLRKHSANRHYTMFDWSIARQGGVHARTLARRANRIDSIVVVVADLFYKLCL